MRCNVLPCEDSMESYVQVSPETCHDEGPQRKKSRSREGTSREGIVWASNILKVEKNEITPKAYPEEIEVITILANTSFGPSSEDPHEGKPRSGPVVERNKCRGCGRLSFFGVSKRRRAAGLRMQRKRTTRTQPIQQQFLENSIQSHAYSCPTCPSAFLCTQQKEECPLPLSHLNSLIIIKRIHCGQHGRKGEKGGKDSHPKMSFEYES